MKALAAPRPRGSKRAACCAVSRATSSASPRATTWLTRPSSAARFALMLRPVSSRSRTTAFGTSRASRGMPPKPGMRPSRSSGKQKRAVWSAISTSSVSASSKPPPKHTPWIAPMVVTAARRADPSRAWMRSMKRGRAPRGTRAGSRSRDRRRTARAGRRRRRSRAAGRCEIEHRARPRALDLVEEALERCEHVRCRSRCSGGCARLSSITPSRCRPLDHRYISSIASRIALLDRLALELLVGGQQAVLERERLVGAVQLAQAHVVRQLGVDLLADRARARASSTRAGDDRGQERPAVADHDRLLQAIARAHRARSPRAAPARRCGPTPAPARP